MRTKKLEYYNYNDYKKAEKLILTNPIAAKEVFEKYISVYPEDYKALYMYSYILIVLKDIEGAKKIVEEARLLSRGDRHFINSTEKLEWVEYNDKVSNIRILAREEKYKELSEYYDSVKYTHSLANLWLVEAFCNIKLGKETDTSRMPYLLGQLKEYDEDSFYYHVLRHTADYNANINKPNDSFFSSDFDVEKVINEVKKIVPTQKGLAYGIFDDIYIFKYDNCGRFNNKIQDYFKVVSFLNSSDLITMYPVSGLKDLPNYDLNYMKKNEKKIFVMSPIEKFKEKYKNFKE